MPSATTASQQELKDNKVPIAWRDQCSALLIPLNTCRKQTMYLPWECNNERHTYEKCVYALFLMRRMKKMSKIRLQKAEEAEE
ncbi:hypothetical protein CONPUDRAFT_122469 [Coniophora puteana RWD-64-598 SS2]|uniref:NADH dehydrogenase [ubiquinone] 1 beta subcomplex subunit 7 n=1 Tax=Coniophora puteana (strain RWD-64-598) TaxID=741705 RepID=A0A5M3MTV7_CONPW|nr:uncharacterized protein CONPUDRAFT_122469 [Coniophora puteana RWD-64-598 SS2]EIW81981.1 hypothetical protein CONPUDRAFT_122469 [Coniophora puteana RWD-64-598 SS2]